jgi:hypothetical protein
MGIKFADFYFFQKVQGVEIFLERDNFFGGEMFMLLYDFCGNASSNTSMRMRIVYMKSNITGHLLPI